MSQERIIISRDGKQDTEAWQVRVWRKNIEGQDELVLDSGGADFPINVREFGAFDDDLLIQSLKSVFPEAEIRVLF